MAHARGTSELKEAARLALKVEKSVREFYDAEGKPAWSTEQFNAVSQTALTVLAGVTGELGSDNLPKNPVDRAIAEVLIANRDRIASLIQARVREGQMPTSVEYYELAYGILKDSGLLRVGTVSPEAIAAIQRARVTGAGLALGNCDACSVCGLCGACSACGTCLPVIGVIGAGATAGTLGTGGALGYFF
jgi:hypothetical protein